MNQSSQSRLILIAIMLFFLLLAAITFFVQARQRLSAEVADLTGTRQALSTELADTDEQLTTMAAVAAAQATTSANLNDQVADLTAQVPTYEAQITSFQQEVATLTVTLGETRAEMGRLQTEQDALHSVPPHVRLISPANGATYEPGEAVPIVISASDAYGLAAVNVTVDDNTLTSLSPQADEPLVTVYQTWTPPSDGAYTIGIMAVDIDGNASPLITSTITVVNVAEMNAAIRAEIEANVVAIRGLEPLRPLISTLLTRDELRSELEAEFDQNTTEAESDNYVLFLNAFDFVPRNFDYYGLTLDIYSEQVTGYYDAETQRFVVISEDALLSTAEQITHAHEYAHALQDQHYDLSMLFRNIPNEDAALALRALVEGDAELVEDFYVNQYVTNQELQAVAAEYAAFDTTLLDAFPIPLLNLLIFPYEAGLNFVQTLYDEGGFDLINDTWENPPTSTEQVLHPTRYLAGDEPQTVELETLIEPLGVGWELLNENVFGEFFLREYLAQQLDEEVASAAAEGWGGDQYAVYWDEQQELMLMLLRVAWDSEDDAAEFAAAYDLYASQKYNTTATISGNLTCWSGTVDGISDTTCLYEEGDETFIVRAPNFAMIQAIVTLHYPPTGTVN